ncbi:CBS domain-containing protein [Accumulibacter sp.]|uniref:CBS domain-containing protein n=1 Tax=Accumulibacter sp. TaxID=2053492 RepID=UPI0025D364F7|nr:CBS domain-containing protein [Accumulibacter sp.]MCM8626230.1 CBS domain-containing protein [Accumulibacter sp.]
MPETRFKPLAWTKLQRGVPCYLPQPPARQRVDVHSPALSVMTDFQRLTPITVRHDMSLDEANRIMGLSHAQYLLVADGQNHLLGIASEASTRGHHPLAVAHQLGIRPGELMVGEVMIKKHDDAEVMHLRDVRTASVGNVLAALKELASPFCLVVDHDEEDHHVLCGIFSLAHIERLMGVTPSVEVAQTFSQVVSSLGR